MNIESIKASLIQLAISGKLVAQLDSEEEVYQLGEKPKEVSFEIPSKWKWIQIKNITNFKKLPKIKGYDIKPHTWVLELEYVEKKTGKILAKEYGITKKSDKNIFTKGSVLYGKLNPHLQKAVIVDEDGVCTSEMIPFLKERTSEIIYMPYLKYLLISQFFASYASNLAYGVKMPRLSTDDLENSFIPIPPLDEQNRIVSKLENLLFALNEYDNLNSKKEIVISKLKAKILEEAIFGKLVSQLDSEEEVHPLGEKPKEVPFEIPSKWKWVNLSNIGEIQTGTTPKTSIKENFGNDISFVKPGDISKENTISYRDDGLSFLGQKTSRTAIKNSILMVGIGGSIGKCSIVDKDVCFNQQIHALTVDENICNYKYIYYAFSSKFFFNSVRKNATGTATPIINKSLWSNLIVPIPPLEEQKRIVAKIEELFSQIELLKS